MSQASSRQYLDGKVLSASQPQLHLMLLDGACRFCRKARELWGNEEDLGVIDQLLGRAADIVGELTHGAAAGSEETSKQLEEQYAFIYRELASCRINQSVENLDTCIELLAYERETWVLACKKHEEEAAKPRLAGVPHLSMAATPASGSLSLEA